MISFGQPTAHEPRATGRSALPRSALLAHIAYFGGILPALWLTSGALRAAVLFTNLASFDSTNAALPEALIQAPDGYFYGVTRSGGISNNGAVFRCSSAGELTNLVFFNRANGRKPYGELTPAADGNLYGTTSGGPCGGGTVYRVTPAGVLTTLVAFTNTLGPYAGLTPGEDGDFYGTTFSGGAYGRGAVSKLSVSMPPAFESVTQPNAVIVLTWSTVAGQRYQLQPTSDLSAGNWVNVGSAIYATGGASLSQRRQRPARSSFIARRCWRIEAPARPAFFGESRTPPAPHRRFGG